MLRLFALTLLAGCQVLFPLEDSQGVQVCAGNSPNSLTDLCVDVTREELGLLQQIDTGDRVDPTDEGDCDSIVEQQLGPEVCVISALTINIGNTVVIGARPLVLVSASDLVVTGTLSAASRLDQAGPGADFTCPGDLDGEGATTGGAGGAGGSFASEAGGGGNGAGGASAGDATFDTTPLSFIRGGCAGGSGGVGTMTTGGSGGNSGGALYLIAKTSITIGGTLDACGEGGGGGGSDLASGGGGGGGGSGGLIALDAPSIVLADTAKLVVNGGGGGAGGGANNNPGDAGETPNTMTFPFPASGGFNSFAGDGGNGANANDLGAGGGSSDGAAGAGGGGGGGSTGFLLILGSLEDRGAELSPRLP